MPMNGGLSPCLSVLQQPSKRHLGHLVETHLSLRYLVTPTKVAYDVGFVLLRSDFLDLADNLVEAVPFPFECV